MADADWDIVQRYVYVKDPYATRKVERDLDQLTNTAPVTCPKCLAAEHTNEDPTPNEWREMMHEARLRLLKAEKISYWKQFEHGMLSSDAVIKLSELVDTAQDTHGGLIDVEEIKKTWATKGLFDKMVGSMHVP